MSNGKGPAQRGPVDGRFGEAPTSGREDEMAAWRKREAEGRAICDAYNSQPGQPGILSCGWAWKGFGYRLDMNRQADHEPGKR